MLKVLSSILCDLDPKVKAIGQKAGICDGVPSTSALVVYKLAAFKGTLFLPCSCNIYESMIFFSLYPISPRIILVPIVPDLYIWLIGRISGKAIGVLQTITGNHLGRSGKVRSPKELIFPKYNSKI